MAFEPSVSCGLMRAHATLLEKYDEHHQPGNRSHGDESLD